MTRSKAAKKAAKTVDDEAVDRGEPVALIEPLTIPETSRRSAELADLAVEVAQRSAGFRRSLPASLVSSLAGLVRSMNCYYSNLIEGHDTHPIDIERALRNDYSQDPRKRDLQIEAKAHIAVQQWLDGGALAGRAMTADAACEIHRRFGELLPEEMLFAEDPDTNERVRWPPGRLRTRDVRVGRHVAVSPGAVPRFLRRFEEVYSRLGRSSAIVSTAAAHHRFLWIHPFLDGNGRVARLMSHASLLELLDTGGLWSVARGLARSVEEYKRLLVECDQPRRNDLDGRGNLSEEALTSLTRFFLETCLDQVSFMEGLMQPERLHARVRLWAEEGIRLGELPSGADAILDAILYRGELPRGDAARVVGSSDRSARRVVSSLLQAGVLVSESSRAPLRLSFPADLAWRWMPGLFPAAPTPASRS